MTSQFDKIFVKLVCTYRNQDANFIDQISKIAGDVDSFIKHKEAEIEKHKESGEYVTAILVSLQFMRDLSKIEQLIAEFDSDLIPEDRLF